MAGTSRRKTRRSPGEGTEWHDAKTKQWRWRIRWQGKDYAVADLDRSRAKADFEELKERLKKQINVADSKQLLRDFLLYWLEEVVRRDVRHGTYLDYKKRCEIYITPTLGDYRLCDLHPKLIRAWMNALRDTYAFSSAKQARAMLDRALQVACDEKLIDFNPAASVRPPQAPASQHTDDDDEEGQRALSVEQVERLLDEAKRTDKMMTSARGLPLAAANAVRGDGVYALYTLAVRLGLRRGELLGLRWRDIDFDRRTIRVRQQVTRDDEGYRISSSLKTPAARRTLPLEDDIADLLLHVKAKLGARADVKDLVFPDKDGHERDPQSVTRTFARTVKRLGLGDFHLHDLRHTAVTRWRRAGVDLEVAAALAGHEKADTTANIYSDADMDRKRDALKRAS